jgi:hypothetical protein
MKAVRLQLPFTLGQESATPDNDGSASAYPGSHRGCGAFDCLADPAIRTAAAHVHDPVDVGV